MALVADDHELFRAGIAAMLKRDLGFRDVIEVGSLDEALFHLGRSSDVTLASFDLAMPGVKNAGSFKIVREMFPTIRSAVISASSRHDDILQALGAGMHGFIPKVLRIPEIVRALRLVLEGHVYVPWSLTDVRPVLSVKRFAIEPSPVSSKAVLTPRQSDVLRLMSEGKSNKEIARLLSLAEGTVKVHTNALFRALGVHNRSGAVGSRSMV